MHGKGKWQKQIDIQNRSKQDHTEQSDCTINTGSGNNIQACNVCADNFNNPSSLKMHKLKKHRSNFCDFPQCIFTSQNPNDIGMHKNQCHSEEESACTVDTELLNSLQADNMDIDIRDTGASKHCTAQNVLQ